MLYFIRVGNTKMETESLNVAKAFLMAMDGERGQEAKQIHKKHQFKKQCPDCPKSFKGNVGLGIHRATMHGYTGRVKAYYERKKVVAVI